MDLPVKDKQLPTARVAALIAILFFVLMLFPFYEGNPLSEVWGITFLSFFLGFTSVIIAVIYWKRSRKLRNLVLGKTALAYWQLTDEEKKVYAQTMFEHDRAKNIANFKLLTILMVVIFGIFIVLMDDDNRMVLVYIFFGYMLIFSLFAFLVPYATRNKNLKGDGKVYLGKEYAYVNGSFHSWDAPTSGLVGVEIIQKPFYGLFLCYYYTIRSTRNTVELIIPAPKAIDLDSIVKSFK